MKKTVYWIEGDGIGPEVWRAARPVIDAAVAQSAGGHSLEWIEVLAGEKALRECGEYLPESTLKVLRGAELAMKGPIGTPVGGGIRSINVALRHALDLYACIRPVRYMGGLQTPVTHPERVNIVVFRENTEDVYAGIEYASATPEAKKLIAFLRDEMGAKVNDTAAIGIKPMTPHGSKRLVRRAIQYALDNALPSVTLVHKGNIMKFTEGGFRQWGYDLAAEEFAGRCVLEQDADKRTSGQIVLKDRIADAMFQEALLRPEQYHVLATPNLNGDYLSDALAAQVGGLGLAPGVNMSDTLAFFEATHGTAPRIAGQDKANPGSVILCGALMLEHLGWHEAAQRVRKAVDTVLAKRIVTEDLAGEMPGATVVGCKAFGEAVGAALTNVSRETMCISVPTLPKTPVHDTNVSCETMCVAGKHTPTHQGYALAWITLSDKGAAGEREDKSGPMIEEMLRAALPLRHAQGFLLADDAPALRALLTELALEQGYDIICTTGSTGLGPRDIAPQATEAVLNMRLPGFEQAMMAASLAKTPHAALSRAVVGTIGRCLCINLPGSVKAVRENLAAILPALSHALKKLHGDTTDCGGMR